MGRLDPVRAAFWNDGQRRLRLPWRLLLAALLFAIVAGILSVALGIGAAVLGLELAMGPETLGLSTTLSLAVVAGTLWVVARLIDRRPYADYGLGVDREWAVDLAFGLALGAGLPTAVFLVGWLAGWIRVSGTADGSPSVLGSLLVLAVTFVAVGILEELLVRGWLLTNLAEGFQSIGDRWAVILAVLLSSVVFGALHLGNPGASLRSAAGITLAGIFLALGYVLTGELAIAIGAHITWNFFLGPVYGLPVSGLAIPVTLVESRPVGPAALTGGPFGPEAGLLGAGAVVLGMAAIAWWVRRRTGAVAIDPRIAIPPRSASDDDRPS